METRILGILVKPKTQIYFYQNGDFISNKVQRFVAGQDFEKYGLIFKAGSVVTLYPDGCLRGGEIYGGQLVESLGFHRDSRLTFCRDGRILSLNSASYSFRVETNGRNFRGTGWASFHENGSIEAATLAQAEEIGGCHYPAFASLHFNPEGKIDRVVTSPGGNWVLEPHCPA